MILMSDFTTEQLKAIVKFGIDNIKEELEERIEIQNKEGFQIKENDCFFCEEDKTFYRITKVVFDRIHYELTRADNRQIISSYNSFIERDSHNFDGMIKIDKDSFDLVQNIASNYEQKLKTLKESSIKSVNNIISSIRK